MSTKVWDLSCFLIRNMFGSLVVYLTHLASHMHFSCFGHALHITTLCTHLCYPCHALVYTLFPHPSMSCLPYTLQHSFFYFLGLRFKLHFLIHLAPLMHHYHCSYLHLLPLFILDPLSTRDKKGESILQRVSRRVLLFLYNSCAHPQGEKFYFLCTFVGGEIFHRRDPYTKGKMTLC